MTVNELHELTRALIAKRQGNAEVAIDFSTFTESENGTILDVTAAEVRRVQGADDSGPVGPKFTMLVLSGGS